MQTSNEEFRASIEQLQSTNEQLQSTNEQLETSKEQIQSMNEQLTTLNTQLQSKMTELARVNDDMNSLSVGTDIGTIFVDREARIRSYSSAVTQFITLVQSDIGRPLRHVVAELVGYEGLLEGVESVLHGLTPASLDVQMRASARYSWHIRPHLISGKVIDGAVITFSETMTSGNAAVASQEAADCDSSAWPANNGG